MATGLLLLMFQGSWRPQSLPPLSKPLETPSRLPDFRAFSDAKERKTAFLSFLQPIIAAENDHQLALRDTLLRLRVKARDPDELNEREREWLAELVRHYRISAPPDTEDEWQALLARVDIVPASLALAQAALESGWGTSRVAREGLNFFGQRCFKPGCGQSPKRRRSQHLYENARYDSAEEAVRRYIHNLNTLQAYQPMRRTRASLRKSNQGIDGYALSEGLTAYSELKDVYVQKVRHMIVANDLQRYD